MSDLESAELVKKLPTVVVSMASIFGSVSLCGDKEIAQEVLDLVIYFSEKGYYILIDCDASISVAYNYLLEQGIPFNGLTYDRRAGCMEDAELYLERVDHHIGWDNVCAIIDEDIVRLTVAKEKGVSCIHIMQGCVISQMSFGKMKTIVPEHKTTFTAGERASIC